MSPDAFAASTVRIAPDPQWSRPLAALLWLKKGGLVVGPEYETGHGLCQMDEGERDHDRVHALSHWIEGDMPNAAYWYRQTGETRAETIEAEWRSLVTDLAASEPSGD